MHKKVISMLLALSVLASCLMAVPVFASGEALTGITPGGQWAEKEVMSGEDFLNSSYMPTMEKGKELKYDKTNATAYQNGYQSTTMAKFNTLRLNAESDGILEINMDVTMKGDVATIFPAGSTDTAAYASRFFLWINNVEKGLGATYDGLNVKYSTATGAATYGFPWSGTPIAYTSGVVVPVKYVIEKRDNKISATNWAKIGDNWIKGAGSTAVKDQEGAVTGVGIMYGHNGTRGEGSVMEWAYSNASVIEKTVPTVRLTDLSKNYYPAGNETVPVEFVLPADYETATLSIGGEGIATFDPSVYPADAYTANLELSAISGTGSLDVELSGTAGGEAFSATTVLNRGIDEDYVPPISIPAKVAFQNSAGGELTAITAGQSVKVVGDSSIAGSLLVLGLYQDKVLKAIKSGTGEVALTVPSDIDGTKASLKAFVLNSLDDANTLVRAGQWNNSDAGLAELQISGKPLAEYSDDKTSYDVTLPASVIGWPEITPVAKDSGTSAVVTHTGKFPGTTTIALKAEDGTGKTVTLNWTREKATILDYSTTTGKQLSTVVLEKPKFVTTPSKEIDFVSSSKASEDPERNSMYGTENILNRIEVCTDRPGQYWIVSLPDELDGATMLKLPYDSTMWSHATNVAANHKLITFKINSSATVYVYHGNGRKDSTWAEDNGWVAHSSFQSPIVMTSNATKGNLVYIGPNWGCVKKHFDVEPWGDPATVDVGCMNWSTNTIIVKFDE